ncbi:Inositol-1-monophosphatase [Mucinivorans hirudinis]|uniref:Inositol-1-monophosphatase n=1 Tax=Mucinivorans hirudinis TaxID=1433126 RepID=A0A060R6Y2_9BACT|nr:Inositol-1-monophosphatase [Mucinivorans hirudinis]
MYSEFLDFAINLAREVGKIQLSYFRSGNLDITTKTNVSDIVTRADKECEEYIVKEIFATYADHKILGEEGGFRGNEASEYMWVVDPLDGTTNYSQGLPIFAVSIGLVHKEQTILGVVYAPYLKELFYAVKGGGAYMQCGDNEALDIRVADKRSLDCSVIGTGFPYDKGVNADNNSDNVARIVPYVRDLRRMGSAAYDLCAVAAGMLDGYWEMTLNLWDVCAGNLIVQEAGGVIFNYRLDRKISIIAGNGTIIEEIKRYIQ